MLQLAGTGGTTHWSISDL